MEMVDIVGKWHDPTYFFLKIASLANARPSKLIRPPVGTCTEQIASTAQNLYNPVGITLGWGFYKNPSLPDKEKLSPDKGMCPFNIT